MLQQNPIQNFESIVELFYWSLNFHLLGTRVPKYKHFHDDGTGDLEQCTKQSCSPQYKEYQ